LSRKSFEKIAEKPYEFILLRRVEFGPLPPQGAPGQLHVVEDLVHDRTDLDDFSVPGLVLEGGIRKRLQHLVDLHLHGLLGRCRQGRQRQHPERQSR